MVRCRAPPVPARVPPGPSMPASQLRELNRTGLGGSCCCWRWTTGHARLLRPDCTPRAVRGGGSCRPVGPDGPEPRRRPASCRTRSPAIGRRAPGLPPFPSLGVLPPHSITITSSGLGPQAKRGDRDRRTIQDPSWRRTPFSLSFCFRLFSPPRLLFPSSSLASRRRKAALRSCAVQPMYVASTMYTHAGTQQISTK